MTSTFEQIRMDILAEMYVMSVEYKYQVEAKLKGDPNNKQLREAYKVAITMEKQSFGNIKKRVMSLIDPDDKEARNRAEKLFTLENVRAAAREVKSP